MHVGFRREWDIRVEDSADILEVDAPREHVRRDEHKDLAQAELLDQHVLRGLRHAVAKHGDPQRRRVDRGGELGAPLGGVHEDQHRGLEALGDLPPQRVDFARLVADVPQALRHRRGDGHAAADENPVVRQRVDPAEGLLEALRDRRAEQTENRVAPRHFLEDGERLAVHLRAVAVEQPVELVEDAELEVALGDVPRLEEPQDALGGADEHVVPRGLRLALVAPHAADPDVVREEEQLALDLHRELTRGDDDNAFQRVFRVFNTFFCFR